MVDVDTLRNVFRENNAHREQLYDQRADQFISEVRQYLQSLYGKKNWISFSEATQLGITLRVENIMFDSFKFGIDWILCKQDLAKDYKMPKFKEFFAKADFKKKHYTCCIFEGRAIVTYLMPFIEALERKGFDVYFDKENSELVVAFNIVEDRK